MSLFTATILMAAIMGLVGIFFWKDSPQWQRAALNLGRSQKATVLLFGAALAWFLWIVAHLGEGDFGDYKHWLFLLFATVGLLAFWQVPDFLSVRGIAGLILLSSYELLMAAYMQEPQSRLLMVSAVYVWIVIALFLGAMPFLWRDGLSWLFERPALRQWVGISCSAYAAVLAIVGFTYL